MTTSVATPLMQRTVCKGCGHLHREPLAKPSINPFTRVTQPAKCDCCKADWQEVNPS